MADFIAAQLSRLATCWNQATSAGGSQIPAASTSAKWANIGTNEAFAGAALLLRLNGLAFGEPYGSNEPSRASFVPVFAHLALVFGAGIWLPPALVAWFQHVATLLN